MKQAGCCTLCNRAVFEILSRYTEGEVAGWPGRIGAPHQEARRVHLVFADGSTGAVTLCADCEITPATLPQAHHQIRRRWAFDGTNGKREQLGGAKLDVAQSWRQGAWQLSAYTNVPLGVLCEERWTEAMAREGR